MSAATPITTITYRPEWTDRGWVVWRKAGAGAEIALRYRARDRAELVDAIAAAHRADSAACSRLGLTCARSETTTDLLVFAGASAAQG